MEAGAHQRYRADIAVGPRTGVRESRKTHCDACRLGMRGDRREIPGDADGVVRADHRRSAQSQRAGADFDGAELLEVPESRAGAGCQQMSENVAELTPKQEEAILALLSTPTVEHAARAAKITPRTLYRYLKDPEFNAAYRQARWTAFGQCTARLQQASSAAVRSKERRVGEEG